MAFLAFWLLFARIVSVHSRGLNGHIEIRSHKMVLRRLKMIGPGLAPFLPLHTTGSGQSIGLADGSCNLTFSPGTSALTMPIFGCDTQGLVYDSTVLIFRASFPIRDCEQSQTHGTDKSVQAVTSLHSGGC